MSPTPTTDARPRVDAGALGKAVFGEAAAALAETLVLAIDWNEEDDNELNQRQKITLARVAILNVSNLEATMTKTIVDTLERNGVETWGLSPDLERLLQR